MNTTNDMIKNDSIGNWTITTTRLAKPVQMGPVTLRCQTVTHQEGKITRMSGTAKLADAMVKHAEHVALVEGGDISSAMSSVFFASPRTAHTRSGTKF